MNDSNLPPGFDYIDTISDPETIKPKTYKFMLNLKKLEEKLDKVLKEETKESLLEFFNKKRISPCQAHDLSEGAESEDELLPSKCIYFDDYNNCHKRDCCNQCKSEL